MNSDPRPSSQLRDFSARGRLPSWKVWAAGAIVLLLSQALTIGQGYITGTLSGPVTGKWILHDVIFWFSWFAVSPLVFLVAGRYPLDRPTFGRISAHLIAFPVVLTLAAVLRILVRWPFWGFPLTFPKSVMLAISSSMMIFLLLYTATVILFYALEYYHAYHSRALRSSQLETMVVRAELDALRNQLQPHFLFNTLHAISALMAKDVGAARRMMTRFSDLLRLALDEPEQHEVRLDQELHFLDQYLDLQRMRFGDRLEVELDVTPSTLDCLVPQVDPAAGRRERIDARHRQPRRRRASAHRGRDRRGCAQARGRRRWSGTVVEPRRAVARRRRTAEYPRQADASVR